MTKPDLEVSSRPSRAKKATEKKAAVNAEKPASKKAAATKQARQKTPQPAPKKSALKGKGKRKNEEEDAEESKPKRVRINEKTITDIVPEKLGETGKAKGGKTTRNVTTKTEKSKSNKRKIGESDEEASDDDSNAKKKQKTGKPTLTTKAPRATARSRTKKASTNTQQQSLVQQEAGPSSKKDSNAEVCDVGNASDSSELSDYEMALEVLSDSTKKVMASKKSDTRLELKAEVVKQYEAMQKPSWTPVTEVEMAYKLRDVKRKHYKEIEDLFTDRNRLFWKRELDRWEDETIVAYRSDQYNRPRRDRALSLSSVESLNNTSGANNNEGNKTNEGNKANEGIKTNEDSKANGGSKNEGSKNEGSKNEGSKNEGSKNEGSKANEGSKNPEGSKNEGNTANGGSNANEGNNANEENGKVIQEISIDTGNNDTINQDNGDITAGTSSTTKGNGETFDGQNDATTGDTAVIDFAVNARATSPSIKSNEAVIGDNDAASTDATTKNNNITADAPVTEQNYATPKTFNKEPITFEDNLRAYITFSRVEVSQGWFKRSETEWDKVKKQIDSLVSELRANAYCQKATKAGYQAMIEGMISDLAKRFLATYHEGHLKISRAYDELLVFACEKREDIQRMYGHHPAEDPELDEDELWDDMMLAREEVQQKIEETKLALLMVTSCVSFEVKGF